MREFGTEVRIEEDKKSEWEGNERKGRSFCSEKERRKVGELENVKRWRSWGEWKGKKNGW